MEDRDYIIADDLSGALEAGAAFHVAGRRVCVPLEATGKGALPRADVVALSTETRLCEAAEARWRVRRALESMERSGGRCVLKKIDSTLRGPIGVELNEVLAWRPESRLIVAPSTPRAGRTVREGVLYVNGVPVSESAFAGDALPPVRESDVAGVIADGCRTRMARLLVGAIRQGIGVCTEMLRADRARVVIADAETEGDLDTVVAAALAIRDEVLFVGAGGLAGALARTKWVEQREDPSGVGLDPVEGGACLFVCGSAHAVNREQLEALRERHGVPVVSVDAELVDGEWGDVAQEAVEALGEGARLGKQAVPHGEAEGGAAALVLENMRTVEGVGEAVAEIDERARVSHVFATGGETARAVCEGLEGRWLRIVEQVEPGVVASEMSGEGGRRLVVTKPGGFGDAETMVRVWNWFENASGDDAQGADG